MGSTKGPSLFPLHHCKTLHLPSDKVGQPTSASSNMVHRTVTNHFILGILRMVIDHGIMCMMEMNRQNVGFGLGKCFVEIWTFSPASVIDNFIFPSLTKEYVVQVRHAQGIHNVEGEKNHDAYLSPALFDAHLTPLGWDQVHNLRKHIHECGLDKKIELVIVSPLLRTMQTAVGVFGGENYVDGVHASPLMVANAGNSDHPAISSLNCPSFLAMETCREHLGVHPCDKRRSITEYRTLFPAIDFSLIESDEDILWTAETREANEAVAARGMKFMNWLWTRKEKEIAVVSHSGFLFHTLNRFGDDCHPLVKKEISKHFANCELRSLVLVNKCGTSASDSSATNYPGKVPHGPDLPSVVVEEKLGNNST